MTTPIHPTPEDSRFFNELSRLEPSQETDHRILEGAGFQLGRQNGMSQIRRYVFQSVLWAAMIIIATLIILFSPELNPNNSSSTPLSNNSNSQGSPAGSLGTEAEEELNRDSFSADAPESIVSFPEPDGYQEENPRSLSHQNNTSSHPVRVRSDNFVGPERPQVASSENTMGSASQSVSEKQTHLQRSIDRLARESSVEIRRELIQLQKQAEQIPPEKKELKLLIEYKISEALKDLEALQANMGGRRVGTEDLQKDP